LLTETTNARFAQPDNWLMLETTDVFQEPTIAELDNKFKETNSHAMLVLLALNSNFQTRLELDVSQDHSLTVVV